MVANRQSLLDGGGRAGQLELLSPDAGRDASASMPAGLFADFESTGDHTAARLFASSPETYKIIISLLAEGHGLLRVARMVRASVHTVIAVRDREGVAIDKQRERLASTARTASTLAVEGLVEDLADDRRRAKISPYHLALIHAITTDKAELLSGGATVRVDVTDSRAETFADLLRLGREMGYRGGAPEQREPGDVRDVEGVEVGPAPGAGVDPGGVDLQPGGPGAAADDDDGGQTGVTHD